MLGLEIVEKSSKNCEDIDIQLEVFKTLQGTVNGLIWLEYRTDSEK